jgi:CheY-like chemotaxis protein
MTVNSGGSDFRPRGHVLVVEDDYLNQVLLKRFLMEAGFEVSVANDGEQAIEMLENQGFDLVLMDIQLPGLDGYETTGYIRARSETYFRNIPIIACTGSSQEETQEKAMKYGLNDFLLKPFTADQIVQKINQYAQLWATPQVTN